MRTLVLLMFLASCGSDKDTVVVPNQTPVGDKEPLTKCDEEHDISESKIVDCGIADAGIRVMVCSKVGWYEAYATCKADGSRDGTPAILTPEEPPESTASQN